METSRFLLLAARLTRTNALLLHAVRRSGLRASWIDDPEEATPLDTVLGRLDVLPTLDGIDDGLWGLRRFELAGGRVLNPADALLASHDKFGTALALERSGVPHPRTAWIVDAEQLSDLHPPVVVKPRFGSWGRDVRLCSDRRELVDCLAQVRRTGWFRRHGAIVQELVEPTGIDLRVVVARDRVVGAISRVASAGEWRTNVALGGRRQPLERLPARAAELALGAAAAVGGDLVGVDLLPAGPSDYVVLEVNGAVDFTAAYALHGVDPFEAVADALCGETAAAAAV